MRLVRLATILALALLCTTQMPAQQVFMNTWEAFILPSPAGVIIQYSFPLGPLDFWAPGKKVKTIQFQQSPNSVQIQTAGDVSQLLLSDSHDVRSPSCTYLGTFVDGPGTQQILQPGGSYYQIVQGTLVGTFTDAFGYQYDNVTALFFFSTYPGYGPAGVPSVGSVTVVLQENGI